MVFNNLLSETRLLSVHVLNSATGSYEELNRTKLYTIAVDSYMATIFSPFPSFFDARYDGEVAPACSSIKLTQTAVVTYMAELSFVNTTNQGNLMIDNTSINVLNLVQTQTDCVSGTFWHTSTGSCMACPQGTSSTPGAINCSSSPPICPSSGGPMGLFTDPDSLSCAEPFDCHVSFCNCVGSPLSTTCTPFATNATATLVQQCASQLSSCMLNAALNAPYVWDRSCQSWGSPLSSLYASYYSNRSASNFTDACKADMCTLVAAGNSSLVPSIDFDDVCTLSQLPTPSVSGAIPGCANTSRTYFTDLPIGACSSVALCAAAYCQCLGNVNTTVAVADCVLPIDQPSTTLAKSCFSAASNCLLKAALDVYVPGASPLDFIPKCVLWSIDIAQDYAAYYNASDKSSTLLFKACNNSACSEVLRYNKSTELSNVCDFNGVAGRQPTYVAYDPCPYMCPNKACATNLSTCECSISATISSLFAELSHNNTPTIDLTKSQSFKAYASYANTRENCSTFDYNPYLRFSWSLSTMNGTIILATSASQLFVPAFRLVANQTYFLNLTATGLLGYAVSRRWWTFTAVAPAPTVTISGTSRLSSESSTTIKATVVDISQGTFAWSCVVVNGTVCPSLTNATAFTLIIAAGAPVGSYTMTYSYRGQYNSSLNLTVVASSVPTVRVFHTNVPLSASPLLVYLSSQRVLLGSLVQYAGSSVVYSWYVNGNMLSNASSIGIDATVLSSTEIADVGSPQTQIRNTISLRVASSANQEHYWRSVGSRCRCRTNQR